MRAALAGNHRGQPRVHSLRVDERAPAAAEEEIAKRRGLQLLGVHALAQQVDALCRTALRLE